MDYKQKYKEALERAKEKRDEYKRLDGKESFVPSDIEYIFPELKESEDEKIRNRLIDLFKNRLTYYGTEKLKDLEVDDILAWLEKQGERKPNEKIQIGKKYKCIASPRYSTFMIGKIYKPEDKFLCSLMNFCSDCFEPIEDEQNPAWSEEDEKHLFGCIAYFSGVTESSPYYKDFLWLKSLKERMYKNKEK